MLYRHCYITIIYLYHCALAVADIEIRKIGKSYRLNIEIKIQTFEVRRKDPYVVVQNNIVFR